MLAFLLFYSTPVSALAWRMNWSLLSRHVSGDQVSSTSFGLRLNIFAKYKISSTMSARGRVVFNLNEGSYRSLYNDEFAPRKEISLQEALFQWEPLSSLTFQTGILSSGHLNAPLLISPSLSMIGAAQNFRHELSDDASIRILLQQGIPGEREKFYRVGQIDKGIPTLLLERLEFQYKNFSLSVGHFAFNRLAHTTAYESQYMGNSVKSGTKETASFLYPYKGYVLNGILETPINRSLDLRLLAHYVHNTRAPRTRNDGFLGKIGIQGPRLNVYGKYFLNHSDSSPGVYNDKSYGHNNREGFGVELSWKNTLKNYHIQFDFINFRVLDRDIAPAIFQSDTNLARISVTFFPPRFSSHGRP